MAVQKTVWGRAQWGLITLVAVTMSTSTVLLWARGESLRVWRSAAWTKESGVGFTELQLLVCAQACIEVLFQLLQDIHNWYSLNHVHGCPTRGAMCSAL